MTKSAYNNSNETILIETFVQGNSTLRYNEIVSAALHDFVDVFTEPEIDGVDPMVSGIRLLLSSRDTTRMMFGGKYLAHEDWILISYTNKLLPRVQKLMGREIVLTTDIVLGVIDSFLTNIENSGGIQALNTLLKKK